MSAYSGIFVSYESFISTYQKRGLSYTIQRITLSICCNFKTFYSKIDHLKTVLRKTNYPRNFSDSCIKSIP